MCFCALWPRTGLSRALWLNYRAAPEVGGSRPKRRGNTTSPGILLGIQGQQARWTEPGLWSWMSDSTI